MGKFAAKGTTITGPSGLIAQVYSISGPTLSADTAELSAHDSVQFYREFTNTFRDGGEVTLGLRFDPSDPGQSEAANGFLDSFESDDPIGYTIAWPNTGASTTGFQAFVTGYEPTADFDAELDLSVTLKLTGVPTFTA